MLPAVFKPYTEAEYAVRERVCFVLFLAAFVWLLIAFPTGWRTLMISSLAAVFTGATFGCYVSRENERGVWMLALLCGCGVSAFYIFTVAMEVRDVLKGHAPLVWWLAVDVAVAGPIVTIAARASWTVFLQNWALSRRSR